MSKSSSDCWPWKIELIQKNSNNRKNGYKRLAHHGLQIYPALVFFPERYIRRLFVKPETKTFELVFDQFLVPKGLQDVQNDEYKTAGTSDSDYLPSSTLSVLSTFDNTGKIEKLECGKY